MKEIYFYVKNKNYKKGRRYDSPIIGNALLIFFNADFILEALKIKNFVGWMHVSEDDFVSILHILEKWRMCFDTLNFSELPDYKWEGKEVYHPSIKSNLDKYISIMEEILKDFDWKHLEMTANIR